MGPNPKLFELDQNVLTLIYLEPIEGQLEQNLLKMLRKLLVEYWKKLIHTSMRIARKRMYYSDN